MKHNQHNQQEQLVFRFFARRSYSLFAVIGKEVRIGVLSVATLLAASPCLAQHDTSVESERNEIEQETDDTTLPAAEVLATRTPMEAAIASRQVQIITRSQLYAAGVFTVNDVLKYSSQVDVRQRGAWGTQTDISINGGTFNQVAFLINGIPIVNPQTGHNASNFPVSISDIDHIEIITGAATRIVGSQAFSGAINIVTRKPISSSLLSQFQVHAGSYGSYSLSGRLSQRIQHFDYSVSATHQSSDGAVKNSDMNSYKCWATGRYAQQAVELDVQLGALSNKFGANTFYTPKFSNQWEAVSMYTAAAKAKIKTPIVFAPEVSWTRNKDHFQLIRNTPKYENFHRSDALSATLNIYKSWQWGRFLTGASWRRESIWSTNLGVPLDESDYIGVPHHKGKHYTHKDSRNNLSLYAEQSITLRQFTAVVGVTGEKNSKVTGGMKWYPGFDLSYRPTASLKLFASANRAMRLPTFTNLFYKSPTQEGNKDLRPETNLTYSAGVDYHRKSFDLSGSIFFADCKDMIDWVMWTADDKYHATSFMLDNWGVNLRLKLSLKEMLGAHQPFSSLQVKYAYLHQNRKDDKSYFKSLYALEYLRHKLVVDLRQDICRNVWLDWGARYERREGVFLRQENGQTSVCPYGGHWLLNAQVNWKWGKYHLFGSVENITAVHYYDIGNVEQPRRFFSIGAHLSI